MESKRRNAGSGDNRLFLVYMKTTKGRAGHRHRPCRWMHHPRLHGCVPLLRVCPAEQAFGPSERLVGSEASLFLFLFLFLFLVRFGARVFGVVPRGIGFVSFTSSRVMEKKANTSLYRSTEQRPYHMQHVVRHESPATGVPSYDVSAVTIRRLFCSVPAMDTLWSQLFRSLGALRLRLFMASAHWTFETSASLADLQALRPM